MHPDSLRERRRQETSRRLQEAALRLVDQRGFDAVTVDDIAVEAGTSRRTFFNHFATKAGALFDPDAGDAGHLEVLLRSADLAPDPWQALRAVCVEFVADHAHVVATRRRLVEGSHELDTYHRLAQRHVETALVEWAERQPSLDPFGSLLVAQAAAAVMLAAFAGWGADEDPARLCELVDDGFATLAAGLSPDVSAASTGPRTT